MISDEAAHVSWAVSSHTYPLEANSGDKCIVANFSRGVLIAVIDALGHGDQAAIAAKIASDTLEKYRYEDASLLIKRCHEALRNTRGAAVSLASIDWHKNIMTWLGVGNVVGALMSADFNMERNAKHLLVRGGVVGDRLPELKPDMIPIPDRATLVIATDGIHTTFLDNLKSALKNPQLQADEILARYGKFDDDATVLVYRWDRVL